LCNRQSESTHARCRRTVHIRPCRSPRRRTPTAPPDTADEPRQSGGTDETDHPAGGTDGLREPVQQPVPDDAPAEHEQRHADENRRRPGGYHPTERHRPHRTDRQRADPDGYAGDEHAGTDHWGVTRVGERGGGDDSSEGRDGHDPAGDRPEPVGVDTTPQADDGGGHREQCGDPGRSRDDRRETTLYSVCDGREEGRDDHDRPDRDRVGVERHDRDIDPTREEGRGRPCRVAAPDTKRSFGGSRYRQAMPSTHADDCHSRRQLLAALGGAVACGVAGCLGGDGDRFTPGTDEETDWPAPRHDTHNTAYAPDAAGPRTEPATRWTTDRGSPTGPPVVADGTVYLPGIEALWALDTTDGSQRWRFVRESATSTTPPTVHDGTVYVTERTERVVYALDAADGSILWQTPAELRVSAPPYLAVGEFVDKPWVFVGTERGRVHRVDPETGESTATVDLFGAVSTFVTGRLGRRLFVGTAGGSVYALSSAFVDVEGEAFGEAWRRKLGGRVDGLIPDEEGLFASARGGPLACLSDADGTTRWTLSAEASTVPPLLTGGRVVSAGYDRLSAARTFDGAVQWQTDDRFDEAAPVAAGGTPSATGASSPASGSAVPTGSRPTTPHAAGGRSTSVTTPSRGWPSRTARCSSRHRAPTRRCTVWRSESAPDRFQTVGDRCLID